MNTTQIPLPGFTEAPDADAPPDWVTAPQAASLIPSGPPDDPLANVSALVARWGAKKHVPTNDELDMVIASVDGITGRKLTLDEALALKKKVLAEIESAAKSNSSKAPFTA